MGAPGSAWARRMDLPKVCGISVHFVGATFFEIHTFLRYPLHQRRTCRICHRRLYDVTYQPVSIVG
jgi:hypothetical protein